MKKSEGCAIISTEVEKKFGEDSVKKIEEMNSRGM